MKSGVISILTTGVFLSVSRETLAEKMVADQYFWIDKWIIVSTCVYYLGRRCGYAEVCIEANWGNSITCLFQQTYRLEFLTNNSAKYNSVQLIQFLGFVNIIAF